MDWMESLPDDLRENETLKQSDSVEHALRRLVDTRQTLSKALIPPGDDATDDQRSKFNGRLQEMGFVPKGEQQKLDVPDSPDAYEHPTLPDEDPRKSLFDQAMERRRNMLHESGVPKEMAESLLKAEEGALNDDFNSMLSQSEEGRGALEKKYGADFDALWSNTETAAEYLGGVVGLVMADGSRAPLEANERVIEMLSNAGKGMGEDGTPPAGGTPPQGADVETLRLEMGVLDKQIKGLKQGDPERNLKAKERFEKLKQVTAIESGDNSVLGLSPEEFASKVVAK